MLVVLLCPFVKDEIIFSELQTNSLLELPQIASDMSKMYISLCVFCDNKADPI